MPALAKFMAASHYTYNALKMPGPLGVITIPSDEKDAIICVDKMYRDAVAAEAVAAAAPAKESKGKKRDCRDSDKESGKRAPTKCMAPVDDMPECSNSKKSKVAAPQVKKVPAGLAGVMVLSLSAPPSMTNRKARSLPSCGRILMCLLGNHLISLVFLGR